MSDLTSDGETMEIVIPRAETTSVGESRNTKLGASKKGYGASVTKGGGIAQPKVSSREKSSLSKSGMDERGKLSRRSNGVKITWQPGPEKVDRFYINYGVDAKKLTKQVVVDSRDVTVGTHPIYGPILTYTLRDVDPNSPLFFSLMSENKSGRSLPSEVLELPIAK